MIQPSFIHSFVYPFIHPFIHPLLYPVQGCGANTPWFYYSFYYLRILCTPTFTSWWKIKSIQYTYLYGRDGRKLENQEETHLLFVEHPIIDVTPFTLIILHFTLICEILECDAGICAYSQEH